MILTGYQVVLSFFSAIYWHGRKALAGSGQLKAGIVQPNTSPVCKTGFLNK